MIFLTFFLTSIIAHATESTYLDTRSGSLSPWSMQFLLNYSGASLDRPLAELAPNPANDPVPPRVQMGGSMAVRYRASSNLSYGLGTGLQVDTPFHGARNTSLSNPVVDCSWITKNLFVSATAMAYTDVVYQSFFYSSNLALSISTLRSFSESLSWRWGMQFGVARNLFYGYLPNQLETSVGLYPSIDYQLMEALSLRSVVGMAYYQQVNSEKWVGSKLSQTLGLGWLPKRDVYVYGYLLFYPSPFADLSAENSSIGLSLSLNLF